MVRRKNSKLKKNETELPKVQNARRRRSIRKSKYKMANKRRSRLIQQEHNCIEKNSAAFLEFCNEANFSDENVINHVRKLLGDDSIEEYTGYREDNNLLQDFNLLILSSSPDEYKIYCDLLRKEYDFLNDSSYNAMRLKILNHTAENDLNSTSEPSTSTKNSTFGRYFNSNMKRKKDCTLKNLTNLSARKIKQRLRRISLRVLKEKNVSNRNVSNVSDDCILIEVPKEIIVIDDTESEITGNNSEMNVSKTQKEPADCDNKDNQNNEERNSGKSKEVSSNENNISLSNNIGLVTLKDTQAKSTSPKLSNNSPAMTVNSSNKGCDKEIHLSRTIIEIDETFENKSDSKNLTVLSNKVENTIIIPPLYETATINSKILGLELNNSKEKIFSSTKYIQNENLTKARTEGNSCSVKRKDIEDCERFKEITSLELFTIDAITECELSCSNMSINNLTKQIKGDEVTNAKKNYNENLLNGSKKKSLSNIANHSMSSPESLIRPVALSTRNRTRNIKAKNTRNNSKSVCSLKPTENDIMVIEDDEESVVFVGEVRGPSTSVPSQLDFISLTSENQKTKPNGKSPKLLLNPFKKFKLDLQQKKNDTSTPNKLKTKIGEIVFTSSEKKSNEKYNSNTFNPNTNETIKSSDKRMVIIDGSNVAFGHGISNYFSTRGLEIVINFFEKKGHEVKAVVPQFRIHANKTSDGDKLQELYRSGKVILTPGKNLPCLRTNSYDDRFILQLALELDAAIVSNDNYRDLINENPGFKKLIENRVITYTWCNDLFIASKDPYGKRGPTLDFILNRNVEQA